MIITIGNKPEVENQAEYLNIFSSICSKRAFNKSKKYDQSGYKFIEGNKCSNMRNGGFFGLLQYAYINHLNIAINPNDIWAVIVGQLITFVSDNSSQYGKLFSDDPTNKKTLAVPSGSVHRMPVETLTNELRNNLNFDADLVLQYFSTTTSDSALSLQVMLCDMASPFYDYSMYLCGINQIKIGGMKTDWERLIEAFNSLINLFLNHSHADVLDEYKHRVNAVLERFVDVFDGKVDLDYWSSIYTQKNVGSGSQVEVTGWCRDFVIKIPKPCYIENLSFDYGFIDYKNITTGQTFGMIAGAFESVLLDGFYELVYSSTVFEYLEGEEYKTFKEESWARARAKRDVVKNEYPAYENGVSASKSKDEASDIVGKMKIKIEYNSGVYYCPYVPTQLFDKEKAKAIVEASRKNLSEINQEIENFLRFDDMCDKMDKQLLSPKK